MQATIPSATLVGIDAIPIDVEVDLAGRHARLPRASGCRRRR
jgi:hypothetical protein